MKPSLTNLVLQFRDQALDCVQRDLKRTWPRFDPTKNYSEQNFSDLLSSFVEDTETMSFFSEKLQGILQGLSNRKDPPQHEINLAYREFQEAISNFKGGLPKYREENVEALLQNTQLVVSRLSKFIAYPHRIFKDEFGTKKWDDADDVSLSLRIDDSFLKINLFVACNSTIFLQLLRTVCDPSISFPARIITARSNFEVALHTLHLVDRLDNASKRAEGKQAKGALAELEPFIKQFDKSLHGTRSPIDATENHISAYNILDCFAALGKQDDSDRKDADNFYGHLCDFAHPNAGMRSLLTTRTLVPGDHFSWQYILDQSPLGSGKIDQNIDLLLESVERSSLYIDRALATLDVIQDRLKLIAEKEGNKRGGGVGVVGKDRCIPTPISVNDYPSVILDRDFLAENGPAIIPSFFEFLQLETRDPEASLPEIAVEAINQYKSARPKLFEGLDNRSSFIFLIQALKEESSYAGSGKRYN